MSADMKDEIIHKTIPTVLNQNIPTGCEKLTYIALKLFVVRL